MERLFWLAPSGIDDELDFGQLIAMLPKTRPLGRRDIIGSGTVSNKLNDGPGETGC